MRFPFTCSVAGVSWRQEHVVNIHEGQRLLVSKEPDNPYHAHACRVQTPDGRVIGYLPRAVAEKLKDVEASTFEAVCAERGEGSVVYLSVKVQGPTGAEASATGELVGGEPVSMVRTRHSRRVLGTLAGIDRAGRRVLVRGNHDVVAYPDDLVEIVGG